MRQLAVEFFRWSPVLETERLPIYIGVIILLNEKINMYDLAIVGGMGPETTAKILNFLCLCILYFMEKQ